MLRYVLLQSSGHSTCDSQGQLRGWVTCLPRTSLRSALDQRSEVQPLQHTIGLIPVSRPLTVIQPLAGDYNPRCELVHHRQKLIPACQFCGTSGLRELSLIVAHRERVALCFQMLHHNLAPYRLRQEQASRGEVLLGNLKHSDHLKPPTLIWSHEKGLAAQFAPRSLFRQPIPALPSWPKRPW